MIKIPCDECGGSGQTPLPEKLAAVLKLVRQGNETASQILASSGLRDVVSVNAINNRLERLRGYELIERHREGKFWHYRVKR